MKDLEKINLQRDTKNTLYFRANGVSSKEISEFYFPMGNKKGFISAINLPDQVWEHVMMNGFYSHRCPTYEEMTHLKDIFWTENEIAIQVHPKKSEYLNRPGFEYNLHLWRNRNISPNSELQLRQKIEQVTETAKKFYEKGKKKEILLDEDDTKVLLILCGEAWLSWEEVCEIKQHYWQAEEAAIQFNMGQKFDLNKEHLIILWDATNFDLPAREYV